MDNVSPLWTPDPKSINQTLINQFMAFIAERGAPSCHSYDALYQWSIDEKEAFWSLLWDFCEVIGEKGERLLLDGDDMEEARWFPDARLNFAENLLREDREENSVAIYFRAEDQIAYQLTYGELKQQVSQVARWLKDVGVVKGDRVAAYMPNMPETVVAMLAATSLGAVWTSTSPDFGSDSVIERFGQTEPKVLFSVDGYYYNGKKQDIRSKIRVLQDSVESINQTVIVPLLNFKEGLPGLSWQNVLDEVDQTEPLSFEPCDFNDPLYILYSSGTTGKPKCITHKVGGVLLQHLKEHQLHNDIKAEDPVFYFTTCGWMMWNWLVSALASKASLVLYDGSPFYPDGHVLWDYAQDVGVTLFGTSAKYLEAMSKTELAPIRTHHLPNLRTLCSTGSVLAPENFDYVYEAIKQDICLASISGGTDIVSCFVLGCPILPVYRGETQCRGLGMAVEVFNQAGETVVEEKGELVCVKTFPCQPAFFWGDLSGETYHSAYFERFENVWCHGDYVKLTEQGGIVIYGRSDATLNPGGVRIGTAEIYRYVEQLDEVLESIVIGQDWDNDVRVVLFVVLRDDVTLDETLTQKIRQTVRENCTPRHVPAKVVQVAAIPRTKSGKIVELAVRDVVNGNEVSNTNALANPEALELYRDLPELQS